MKKHLFILIAAVAVLASCRSDILNPASVPPQSGPVTFNLTATHPEATKAVKSGWEAGDAIFVFFSNVAAPKHLKMSFDGTSWTSAEYDGSLQVTGALGLKNGDSGTMRAVFLPFGSGAAVSNDGTSFTFSHTYLTYYLTGTLPYAVNRNEVNGAFDMIIPDDFVQFFIVDTSASDGAYMLGTDAVFPCGVSSVAADGTVIETSDKEAGDDMVGYAYGSGAERGYLFSGKLNTAWSYGSNYYFAKTRTSDGSREDYFVTGKELGSHSAVKLPANGNVYGLQDNKPNTGKWVPVGKDITVPLFKVEVENSTETITSLGRWYTCNHGQSVPEDLGTLYSFMEADELKVDNVKVQLPTKEQFEQIALADNCTWTILKVHGIKGAVVKASRGFLFLPSSWGRGGVYWSSTPYNNERAWRFSFENSGIRGVTDDSIDNKYAVRPVKND